MLNDSNYYNPPASSDDCIRIRIEKYYWSIASIKHFKNIKT